MSDDKTYINSEAAKAERKARREAKAARGDFRHRTDVSSAVRVGLIRDKTTGKPKFDHDPRNAPHELQEAWKKLMTKAEIKEFFG